MKIKDLQIDQVGEGICKCMKTKGREKRRQMITHPSRLWIKRRRVRGVVAEAPPRRVFCTKSLDLLDCKGVEVLRSDKEFAVG